MVSTSRFLAFVFGFLILASIMAADDDGYISIIDDANLMFHEAGHLIFGLLGETPGLYGGTLGQLVFPVTSVVVFWRQEQWLSASVASLWFFENINNIAPYVGDARSQKLPLLGGGEHDWTNILSRWGGLEYDSTLESILIVVAWAGLFATLGWTSYLWWHTKKHYSFPTDRWS